VARKPVSPVYKQVLAEHRRRFARVVVRSPSKLRDLYDRAQDRVLEQIAGAAGPSGDTFTAHLRRQVLGQLRQGQAMAMRQMSAGTLELTKTAQTESLRGLTDDIGRLEDHFAGTTPVLPVEEAARFAGIVDKNQTSLLRQFAGAPGQPGLFVRYGAKIVSAVEEELSTSLLAAEPVHRMIDRVAATIDGEWYQGERIVRTETAWAFNAAHRDGLEEASEVIDDLEQRWVELVDDETGAPLDERVSVDSLAIHGQVAKVGGLFIMPPTSEVPDFEGHTQVPESLVGRAWAFPPNRPNDRATIAPWAQRWGVPGWRYVNGQRSPA
jgi:hypothetical protein